MEEQVRVEEACVPQIMRFLEAKYGQKPVDKRHLHTEVDFECADLSFDLKADTRMAQTGRIFVETGSVVKNGQIMKRGWLYNQNCDYILYYDVQNSKLLVFDLKLLRSHEKYIMNFDLAQIQNKGYTTEGRLVPTSAIIYWLNTWWVKLPHTPQYSRAVNTI